MNNDTLRRRNRGLVLKLVATGACASRIALAGRTGLSKMSVSNIVGEFIERGVFAEHSALSVRGQGRNPIHLALAPQAPRMIGLHVFRDACTAVLCDLQLHILREARTELDADKAEDLAGVLCALIDNVMPTDGQKVVGVGVGSIGPVDLLQGRILNPPHFFGIRDFPLISLLRARYDLPVYMDSQYNCAALAEKYFGAGQPYEDFLFIGVSNGIGSGVISGGAVLRSANGMSSELGHTSIDARGPLCACGNRGCLELYAGSRIVERQLRAATGKALDFAGFCALAEAEADPALDGVFSEMTDALRCALTNAVNLLNPEALIFGDAGSALPARYLARLEADVNATRLVRDVRPVKVLRSAFGAQAQIKSSACCLLDHIFAGELPV